MNGLRFSMVEQQRLAAIFKISTRADSVVLLEEINTDIVDRNK